MTNEELNTELYKWAFAEQEHWRDWLVKQSPEEILHNAYEYTIREDILMAMEYTDVTDAQFKALLNSPCPIADIFADFEKLETDHMDDIRWCIEHRADRLIEKDKEAR